MKKFYLGLVVLTLSAVWFGLGFGTSAQLRSEQVFPADDQAKGSRVATLVPQPIPFTQNWSNTNLITVNHDWSNVPGIIGYRGDGMTTANGVDPQTVLIEGGAVVDVTANQMDPNTFSSGGVNEYELANPTIALQGSGTADAPHIVISLDATGTTGINVAYNLRDIDGSTDDSIQAVALQYRVGNTGDYTNIPAGFVADASSGPSQATLVTHVSAALPAACENQPLVQVRIITANATGVDEWIGIDDINITGTGGGNTALSGTGSAAPTTVLPGGSTLLTVSVVPASNPPSTGITVSADLTPLGGPAVQTFFDNGTNGDVTAGDNIFSFLEVVPATATGGNRTLAVSIADAQARTASAAINVTVNGPPEPGEHLALGNPSGATTDVNNPSNYLLVKNQYVMSYHRDRGIPNWVAWHLDSSWIGTANRQDDFRPDTTLPASWYHVTDSDYSSSGFDRGHHCPSGDRTDTVANNSATFLMTNMMPQASFNNQGVWADLEIYCRTLAQQGNELYIYAGGVGMGGSGLNGGVTNTIANGHVVVPAQTWKVIVVLPAGSNDAQRVNSFTRTIAVLMPNNQTVGAPGTGNWRNYRTTVGQIEAITGFNFFTKTRPQVRIRLKKHVDAQ